MCFQDVPTNLPTPRSCLDFFLYPARTPPDGRELVWSLGSQARYISAQDLTASSSLPIFSSVQLLHSYILQGRPFTMAKLQKTGDDFFSIAMAKTMALSQAYSKNGPKKPSNPATPAPSQGNADSTQASPSKAAPTVLQKNTESFLQNSEPLDPSADDRILCKSYTRLTECNLQLRAVQRRQSRTRIRSSVTIRK